MDIPDDKVNGPNLSHEELTLLLHLGELLVAELDLENVLALVAETACQVVQAETLAVPMIDPDRQTFTYRAASGEYASTILGQTFPIHEGACGWVLQHQRPLLFGEGGNFELDSSARWQKGMASSLLVPLICRGAIIGGLSAMGKRGGGAFNPRDLTVLTLFANQASIAIDNAGLFQKLGAEELRLRLVLDSAGEAICGIDVDGRFSFANPASLRMLGYESEAELIGKPMHATIHHSRLDGSPFPFAECRVHHSIREGDDSHSDTEVFWRSDGTSFPVEYWAHPKIQDDQTVGMVLTFVDITERQRATQELALVNFALNHVTEAAYLADEEGRLRYVNDEACRMHGRSRDELLQLRVIDIDAVTTTEAQWADNWEQIKIRKSATFESRHVSLERGDFPVEISANYFEFLGQPYILGLVRDITERKQAESIAEQYRSVIHASFDGFWITDATGRIIDANDAICRISGYSREELLRLSIPDIEADESPKDTAAHIREIVETGSVQFEARHRRKDGAIINVEVSILHVPGLGERLFCFIRDITERKQTEARLRLAASVFTNTLEAITITDVAGTIVEVNDAFTRITGYSRDEAVGQNPRILQSGRQSPEYYATMWQDLIGKGHWTGEIWNRRKNGEVYAEILTISAVRDAAGKTQHYVALFTDITPMKEHQKQLEHMANYDALTGLPNSVLLADRLRQAIAQSQRHEHSLAVVYLDLDGFKAVNDGYGHNVGDELLIGVSQSMKTALREGDTLARIGGDEFVAVLVDLVRPQDCEPVLARMLQAAADPVTVGDAVLTVSASLGVTLYPQDGADADLLLRHADQAMYQAKQAGKNRYHLFDVDQDAVVKIQRESLEYLRRAFDRREFVLYFQPKVNMKTGEVIGAEALIRWQHPERGLLPPAAFLPVIENHPISVELGEWVIDTALTQMTEWRIAGLDMPVSVNVGARQLQRGEFATRLSELLAAHPDIQPGWLELEVLETSALEDIVQVSEVMRACLALGVRFALDDFGTGYSSLTYLKHLPAELLKIDQTFVRGMLGDTDDLSIVEAVVGLATAFRRKVIAEGVETIAHGELLLALGCELAQGYGIARPMPAAELPGWVATWHPDVAWTTWRERTPNHDDLALVFAEVEHRHWLSAIEIYLSGDRGELPPMDVQECRFGCWLEAGGRSRYGEHPEFLALSVLHEYVHARAQELVDLHAQGRQAEALARLRELHVLRDQLIGKLRGLGCDGGKDN